MPDTSGPPIKEFTGINPSTTQGTFTRQEVRFIGFSIYEMTYTFDPSDWFEVQSFETVWLEITNTSDYTGNECVFCWEVAFPSWNIYSLQKSDSADPYDPDLNEGEQVNLNDQAQCQDVCFNEAVPNPPGAWRWQMAWLLKSMEELMSMSPRAGTSLLLTRSDLQAWAICNAVFLNSRRS